MRTAVVALILSGLMGLCAAQSGIWRDDAGKPSPQTESMKSKDGFGGALLATTDEDWAQKWDTPPETKPSFTAADKVPYGKRVFVLMFFANPLQDDKGNVNIRCDFRMVDPNGKVTLEQKDFKCYAGPIAGPAFNMRLSEPVVRFTGDPGDAPGVWTAEVVLRDAVRNVELPLRTTFTLQQP